jgi:Zn-dependent peptidase ImmA (M78 family)/transcriptional regulator with XRE-family HTH domain
MAGINPAMLTLAREYRGLTQAELADRVGITQGYLSKFENGLLPIPTELVQAFADALDWPVGFFSRSDQIYGLGSTCLYHRKQSALPVSVLRLIQARANVLRIGLDPLLKDIALDAENPFPIMDIDEFGPPARIAQLLRATWRLPLGPIQNLVATVESAGGLILRAPFGTRQMDAISHWSPQSPIFLLNSEAPGDRLRFSLAHEIGHLVMHRVPTPDLEHEADQFAAEFLMPEREIKSDLLHLDLIRAAQLKPFWKVAISALIMRARDVGAISPNRAKTLFIEMSRMGYRTHEPVDIPVEEPTVIRALVDIHRQEHGYSDPQLVAISGAPADSFLDSLSSRSRLRAVK